MQQQELEKLYSPSQWTRRFSSAEEIIQYHLKFIEKASAETRDRVPSQLNIPYGSTQRQKIDIFGTDLDDGSPIFVFIHGGYWQMKDINKSSYHFLASNFYRNGIKSIFIGYDLCPDVPLSQIVAQIKLAAKKCLEYAKEKNSKGLYLMGHSAGAHLAASLFSNFNFVPPQDRKLFKGAILVSGVFDLSPLVSTEINQPLKLDEQLASALSPLKQDFAKECDETTFLVIVGEYESPEFVKQSQLFGEKLKNLGLKSEFRVVPKVDHFDIIEAFFQDNFTIFNKIVNLIQM
ncbi:kynurenine formamidase-like [Tribolium madens]|uniref:kynurenine formamidase-like n=1 Tax=Tribolium madens TaxID=41895 RepID=UPI001CF72530|nr:kynurenine formamidase-like [Tribolium madens]